MILHSSKFIDIYSATTDSVVERPFIGELKAGFPSPAADFLDSSIDLNKIAIKHQAATFFGRAKGFSMKGAGIEDGDLLVIDRSAEYSDGKIAVCYIDGEFTIKRIKRQDGKCWLMPENDEFAPIEVHEDNQLTVWGIVTHVLKTL